MSIFNQYQYGGFCFNKETGEYEMLKKPMANYDLVPLILKDVIWIANLKNRHYGREVYDTNRAEVRACEIQVSYGEFFRVEKRLEVNGNV